MEGLSRWSQEIQLCCGMELRNTTLLRIGAKKYNSVAEWSEEIQLCCGMELRNTAMLRTGAKKYNSVAEWI